MTGPAGHTVVWLMRHGQAPWNLERRYLSFTDQPLTAFGERQAGAASVALRRFGLTAVVTSGSRRTAESAAAVLQHQAHSPHITTDEGWREADHGRWEGLTYRDIVSTFPAEARARWENPWQVAPVNGETLEAVQQRTRAAWQRVVSTYGGGKVLVVSHATPIQLMLADLLGFDPTRYWQIRIDLGSLTSIDLYPSTAIIRRINYVPSLRHP